MSLIDRIVSRVVKEGCAKKANMFDVGDVVVLVDQVQGLNKGTLYKVTKNSNPGMITIADYSPEKAGVDVGKDNTAEYQGEVGDEIGEYRGDHFLRYNNEQ